MKMLLNCLGVSLMAMSFMAASPVAWDDVKLDSDSVLGCGCGCGKTNSCGCGSRNSCSSCCSSCGCSGSC